MIKQTYNHLTLFTLSIILIGCGNLQKDSKSENSVASNSVVDEEAVPKLGRTTYAVIWKWATDDVDLVNNNSVKISRELAQLWREDIIENAYYNADSKNDKLENFPNIAFFLKAKNENEARSILDALTVVSNHISSYTLHPVGPLWLGRNTELINKKGITKSYAAVWTTLRSPLLGQGADKLLREQNDMILEYWKNGIIENVYFDVEGTYSESEKTDFVYFVNASSETVAKNICESLPFFKEKMASYQLYAAGIFWMGKYKDLQ